MKSHAFARLALLACLGTVAAGTAATSAVAQETINQASIAGRVIDPQGAVVPGATVTVRHTETNITQSTITDSEGRFRFHYVKVGTYEVRAQLMGFSDATLAISTVAGGAYDLPLTLAVQGLQASVTVEAPKPLLETARSQMAGTVTRTEIQNLPMNGRQFLDLALLVPGVSPTNTASTQLFAETSAVSGQGISVGSQRNLSNSFIVDGLSANDDAAGLSGIPYSVDSVEQFQVVTSGGQAELGRALGGYMNVVTKSGTNRLKGDVYEYFRDDSLTAANALSGTTLPMRQHQFGMALGGPLKKDRTFFFGNVESRRLDQTGLVTISQANVATINARLAAVGYPGAPVTTGIYDNPVHSLHALGKVDHQVSERDHLTVRYSLYNVTSDNSRGAGGLNAPSASAGLDNRDQTVALNNIFSIGHHTVHDTRVQFAYGDLEARSTDLVGPAVSIAGVASFGTLSGSPQARRTRMFQIVDSLSVHRGAHAVRGGVDVLYNDTRIEYPRSFRGAYTFSSLANFLTGTYNNAGFTQTFGTSIIEQNNPNVGFYVQDEWRAATGLTVNAGLRYDLQVLDTIRTDRNNVSPRLGIAWAPFGASRTVIRGGAGLFYDRVPLRALANALLSAGNTTDLSNLAQIGISLSPTQAGAPTFPNILTAAVPTVTLVNLTTMDRDMQNAYSRQVSAEVEQTLGRRGTVSVGYQYLQGRNLIISVNQNVPTCVAAGTNNGCRPVAAYANNSQYSSRAQSNYHGLHVSFIGRPSAWGHYRVSYTLSKSMNNVGEFFFSSPIDPTDLMKDWGRSDDDQRHRLVINGAVNTPMRPATTVRERLLHGFQLGASLQSYSAVPFNITSGVTTVQGTAGRPVVDGTFITRNAGVGDTFLSLNLRLSRSIPLGGRASVEGLLEVFNVTNQRNDVSRNANFGAGVYPTAPSATFNQITGVGEPRAAQLGARLRF